MPRKIYEWLVKRALWRVSVWQYVTFSFCTVLHNHSTKAYSTFEVKISFQIDILLKMLTQKRKRTDFNQARKRLLLLFHNASDWQVNKFLHACVADKREKIFVSRQFGIFSFLSALTLTSREKMSGTCTW